MPLVKFYNISTTTRLGIAPGCFIVVDKNKADILSRSVGSQMGTNFIVLPEGQSPISKVPVKTNGARRDNKKSR